MSSNLSLLPYKYNVTYNSAITTIPAFPGAYIYNAGIDTSPTALPVPIYCSEPAITTYFMFDRDYMLLVLPGFKVEIYADVSFGTFKYSVDNTAGTDLKFFANKTGSYTMSSYKLFYSFPMVGTQELTMNMVSSSAVSSGNAEISIPVTYDNTSYTLYSYKTTGTSTFQYTGPTDVPAFVLVVGGGGAGGCGGDTSSVNQRQGGGGGGAGGVMVGTMTFIKNTTYNCIVGNGGQSSNANGGVSTITNTSQSVNANGGGGGAAPPSTRAGSGGSSGGNCAASGYGPTNYLISRTAGTNTITGGSFDNLGNGGGHAYGVVNPFLGGGGGGGATGGGGAAGSTFAQLGGNGGSGYNWPMNNTTYAGGGGGGSGASNDNPANSQSSGGSGGGGKGGLTKQSSQNYALTNTSPEHGTNGLGGGGGGGGSHSTAFGKGGSGIIIIALRTADIYKLSK